MSGWTDARKVEAEAWRYLQPFFEAEAHGLLLTDKGRAARFLQETLGDLLFRSRRDGRLYSVELKCERRASPNLFLETWSNRNLEDRDAHIARGSNHGWLSKCRADLLFYYFIETDSLYVFDLFKLKRWALRDRNLERFPEKAQAKYDQLNDTHGVCVPLSVLETAVGYRLIHPRQLSFWQEPVFDGDAA